MITPRVRSLFSWFLSSGLRVPLDLADELVEERRLRRVRGGGAGLLEQLDRAIELLLVDVAPSGHVQQIRVVRLQREPLLEAHERFVDPVGLEQDQPGVVGGVGVLRVELEGLLVRHEGLRGVAELALADAELEWAPRSGALLSDLVSGQRLTHLLAE
jgi:hypothetical protein